MPIRPAAAVTFDALGTLVELRDPVPALRAALARHGVEAEPGVVADAFAAEVAFYLPRSWQGSNPRSLEDLRRACAGVFLEELGADVDPKSFAPSFVGALEFELLPAAAETLARLRAAGIRLACVTNWDVSFETYVAPLHILPAFDAVVTSAEAGAPKPEPAVFALALARLGVAARDAVHVGDSDTDREGAAAAGLRFEPLPLDTLPARLGLG